MSPTPLHPAGIKEEKPMPDATSHLPAIPGSMAFVHNVEEAPAYWWLDII